MRTKVVLTAVLKIGQAERAQQSEEQFPTAAGRRSIENAQAVRAETVVPPREPAFHPQPKVCHQLAGLWSPL